MPLDGEYDQNYPNKLIQIGLKLAESFRGSKEHHNIICLECGTDFYATPISKLQNYKKHHLTGCPSCTTKKKYNNIRQQNIQKLIDKGIRIDDDWDGTIGTGQESDSIYVTVTNLHCNHQFYSSAKNLLTRGVMCPICATNTKTANLNKSSRDRSNEWKKTATVWQKYKSRVTKLTRQAYKNNKHKINPNDLPTGRAGTEGAYHIDHIVPIRYCFEHFIPEEICAHPDNLQMLGWRENVGSRDKLKDNVPDIFVDLIKIS